MRSWDRASFELNTRPLAPRLWLVVLAAAVLISVVLFAFALKQMERYREWAAEI